MAPDADCERAERCRAALHAAGPAVHAAGRPPARAWLDASPASPASPDESRRLLPGPRLQSGLTLAVRNSKKPPSCSLPAKFGSPLLKTRSQKRKDKIIAALRPPYFILSIIIIMVAVHAWGSADARAALEWAPDGWWREPWRLLTYGFVHATNAHLALNALVALAVGWRLESEQSWWRVAVVWGGGLAAGALGAGVLQPRVHVVGASAAVYALLTAHLPNVGLRFEHIPLWWFRPLSVLVLAASEGVWALLRAPPPAPVLGPPAPAHDHVAWSAHVFGALVGVPLAFLVFTGENASKRYVLISRLISMAALLISVTLTALYYACWADFEQRV